MSENATLKIHARVTPAQPAPAKDKIGEPHESSAAGPLPERPRVRSARANKRRRREKARRSGAKLNRGDRLLRNSAIACALLLGVLTLGNVDAPWARKASESVERALTMHIDLDESIGALTFVKGLMPESALVFLNISGDTALARPVEGAVSHAWSNLQPWMMFSCPDGAAVCAADSGTVTAVSPMSGGRYGILVDHGEGVESLYASLAQADVSSGDSVARGQALGRANGSCYFEYRVSGESVDPAEALGL